MAFEIDFVDLLYTKPKSVFYWRFVKTSGFYFQSYDKLSLSILRLFRTIPNLLDFTVIW